VKRSEATRLLKQHEAEFRKLGVMRLYLFGSTARDEARTDSDVDLFFDHPRGELGLYWLMDIKETAGKILGRCTDIMTRGSLHPHCAPRSKPRRYVCFSGDALARSAAPRYRRSD